MNCENTVKVPVCGMELSLDTSNIEAGLSKDEVQAMIVQAISSVQAGAGAYIGKMEFTGFTKEELPIYLPGWYLMDGSFYGNDSIQSIKLNSLPQEFKKRFGIINDGESTCVPNFFHNDGRGVFARASKNVGSMQEDAIRNITGYFGGAGTGYGFNHIQESLSGVFAAGAKTTRSLGGTDIVGYRIVFDASNSVPTAEENRPLNIGLSPIIYLGVESCSDLTS